MKKPKLETETQRALRISERQRFLDVYTAFDLWLKSLGFRHSKWNEQGTTLDYDFWTHEINSLYSVELYINEILHLNIRFIRERNKHSVYVINGFMSRSPEMTLDELKSDLLETVKRLRDEKLIALNKLGSIL